MSRNNDRPLSAARGTADRVYRLTPEERSGMVKHVRDEFDMAAEESELQTRDLDDMNAALALRPN